MTQPWLGDACSLVDAFRAGEITPREALDASLAAIESSELNLFSYVATDEARATADQADVSKPFGGVPIGIKELDRVKGWPATEASLVFKDRIANYDSTSVMRLKRDGGVTPVGQTIASEFGGLNVSITRLNGVSRSPWNPERTVGGSSGGSAGAVAAGLVPIATGGDGGGSIRIPAGFTGLVGMKGTAGRIPRGPFTAIAPLTVVSGCLARSVRDVARYYDVAAGYDSRDPYSLPKTQNWEAELGTHELSGKRAVISPTLGSATVRDEVQALIVEQGEALARSTGLKIIDTPVQLPGLGFEWAMANLASLLVELGEAPDIYSKYPECEELLTLEIAFGLKLATEYYNLEMAANVEKNRTMANEKMADIFDNVDFIVTATNPDVAFPADTTVNTLVGSKVVGPENNGALTIPANICGNPAVSIPAGFVDGLPVGMQVIGRHHEDALLFDLTLAAEREFPWPLVAPGAPR